MLPNVPWMVGADFIILFYLSEHRWRIASTPAVTAINTGLSNSHANRRLKVLEDAGLVESVEERQGYYRITDFGERFVLGHVEQEEMDELDPDVP